ncbi:MAG: methyltransferase domain-containing protein [Verrucomicrobia bacterium]|nr:methyltransferase domain-containing protein [Verrucomicrobiota bacterium]
MSESEQPDFWDIRYAAGRTPWDFGGVPAAARAWIAALPPDSRVLIPGAGSGYELRELASAGLDAIAIDFSPAAVERARQILGPALAPRVQLADFFADDFGGPFDAIYERTFLCALPPSLRTAYAARMAELLKPGGVLAGYFFFDATPEDDGPPWGLAAGEHVRLLGGSFTLEKDEAVADSLPLFAGKERWQEWRRR